MACSVLLLGANRSPTPGRTQGTYQQSAAPLTRRGTPRAGSSAWLQADDLIGRVAGQRGVEIGEAADLDAFDHPDRADAARRGTRLALRQPPLQRALIAQHQEHAALARDF